MYTIPKSNLLKKHEILVREFDKYLNIDVIEKIISFINRHEVSTDPAIFWSSLGQETVNMKQWGFYCYDIIINSHSKSSIMCKHLFFFCNNIISRIQETLDDYIHCYYQYKFTEQQYYENEYETLTSTFYKPSNISTIPKIKESEKKYVNGKILIKKPVYEKLNEIQLNYIEKFINSLKTYADFIEVEVYQDLTNIPSHLRQTLEKLIKTLKNKIIYIEKYFNDIDKNVSSCNINISSTVH